MSTISEETLEPSASIAATLSLEPSINNDISGGGMNSPFSRRNSMEPEPEEKEFETESETVESEDEEPKPEPEPEDPNAGAAGLASILVFGGAIIVAFVYFLNHQPMTYSSYGRDPYL